MAKDVEKKKRKGKKCYSQSELNTEKHLKEEFTEKLPEQLVKLWSIWFKAVQPDRIIGKQIEAARVALTRYERTGKVWTRIFPNIPVSKNRQK